jgi:polyisoprenoid-binding protein YceI
VAAGKLRITGDLTIRGVTRPLVLDATSNKAGEHPMLKVAAIGFDATAPLKRSARPGGFAPAVSDEVTLRISTEARRRRRPPREVRPR